MPSGRTPGVASLFFVVTLILAACQSGSPANSRAPEPPAPVTTSELREPNTLDGIYTDAQALRGRRVFETTCSACHSVEDWQDELFLARWEGDSVFRFWYYIYERMPDDAPPYSLPREQVSDVLTYILQLNGLPSGDMELGSDDESIDQHWLHWRGA